MKARSNTASDAPTPPAAGFDIHHRVEHLGAVLAETLGVVISEIPGRGAGPQMLANALGITVATASRLLKALAQDRPVSVLQLIPGPNPLRRIVDSARDKGASETAVTQAIKTIDEFDELIRTEAGDRSAFQAMLSTWLPEERREFEAERRRTIFKAMSEIDGVSADLQLTSMLIWPGQQAGRLDLVNLQALLGIDRIRPDAFVKLGTQSTHQKSRNQSTPPSIPPERDPQNLDGEPAVDGLHSVRLDEFCSARPAPLTANTYGNLVRYALGPTGFGPSSTVDLVVAELNRNELPSKNTEESTRRPYFYQITEIPVRQLVFDLILHQDVYRDWEVELEGFDTAGRGPADVNDESRALDRRRIDEKLTPLGSGLQPLRVLEFPRYLELLRHTLEKLGWDSDEFRSYRIKIPHPIIGAQVTMALKRAER